MGQLLFTRILGLGYEDGKKRLEAGMLSSKNRPHQVTLPQTEEKKERKRLTLSVGCK